MRSVGALPIALAIALCGCGGTIPRTHFYVLGPSDVSRVETFGPTTERGLTIGVDTFRIDPPYDQDRIVYRVGEESAEVGFYAYHRWAAPLARMLPGVIATGYAGIPGVKSVEPVTSGVHYDAVMRGRVLAFEEVDTLGGPRIRFHVVLRLDATDGTELWSTVLSRDAEVPSNDVSDVVERMRSALSDAIRDSRPNLQSVLQQNKR